MEKFLENIFERNKKSKESEFFWTGVMPSINKEEWRLLELPEASYNEIINFVKTYEDVLIFERVADNKNEARKIIKKFRMI